MQLYRVYFDVARFIVRARDEEHAQLLVLREVESAFATLAEDERDSIRAYVLDQAGPPEIIDQDWS